MSKQSCVIYLKDGIVQNRKPITVLLQSLKNGKYMVEISSITKRTLPQNAYLHAVLIPEFRKALVNCGYDQVKNDAQAKLAMKSMFLKRQLVNKDTGEVIEYIQDTSDCTKEEMSILIDEVIKFSAEEMNYQIPYPNEQLMMSYGD